jgi:hypothetical protein
LTKETTKKPEEVKKPEQKSENLSTMPVKPKPQPTKNLQKTLNAENGTKKKQNESQEEENVARNDGVPKKIIHDSGKKPKTQVSLGRTSTTMPDTKPVTKVPNGETYSTNDWQNKVPPTKAAPRPRPDYVFSTPAPTQAGPSGIQSYKDTSFFAPPYNAPPVKEPESTPTAVEPVQQPPVKTPNDNAIVPIPQPTPTQAAPAPETPQIAPIPQPAPTQAAPAPQPSPEVYKPLYDKINDHAIKIRYLEEALSGAISDKNKIAEIAKEKDKWLDDLSTKNKSLTDDLIKTRGSETTLRLMNEGLQQTNKKVIVDSAEAIQKIMRQNDPELQRKYEETSKIVKILQQQANDYQTKIENLNLQHLSDIEAVKEHVTNIHKGDIQKFAKDNEHLQQRLNEVQGDLEQKGKVVEELQTLNNNLAIFHGHIQDQSRQQLQALGTEYENSYKTLHKQNNAVLAKLAEFEIDSGVNDKFGNKVAKSVDFMAELLDMTGTMKGKQLRDLANNYKKEIHEYVSEREKDIEDIKSLQEELAMAENQKNVDQEELKLVREQFQGLLEQRESALAELDGEFKEAQRTWANKAIEHGELQRQLSDKIDEAATLSQQREQALSRMSEAEKAKARLYDINEEQAKNLKNLQDQHLKLQSDSRKQLEYLQNEVTIASSRHESAYDTFRKREKDMKKRLEQLKQQALQVANNVTPGTSQVSVPILQEIKETIEDSEFNLAMLSKASQLSQPIPEAIPERVREPQPSQVSQQIPERERQPYQYNPIARHYYVPEKTSVAATRDTIQKQEMPDTDLEMQRNSKREREPDFAVMVQLDNMAQSKAAELNAQNTDNARHTKKVIRATLIATENGLVPTYQVENLYASGGSDPPPNRASSDNSHKYGWASLSQKIRDAVGNESKWNGFSDDAKQKIMARYPTEFGGKIAEPSLGANAMTGRQSIPFEEARDLVEQHGKVVLGPLGAWKTGTLNKTPNPQDFIHLARDLVGQFNEKTLKIPKNAEESTGRIRPGVDERTAKDLAAAASRLGTEVGTGRLFELVQAAAAYRETKEYKAQEIIFWSNLNKENPKTEAEHGSSFKEFQAYWKNYLFGDVSERAFGMKPKGPTKDQQQVINDISFLLYYFNRGINPHQYQNTGGSHNIGKNEAKNIGITSTVKYKERRTPPPTERVPVDQRIQPTFPAPKPKLPTVKGAQKPAPKVDSDYSTRAKKQSETRTAKYPVKITPENVEKQEVKILKNEEKPKKKPPK